MLIFWQKAAFSSQSEQRLLFGLQKYQLNNLKKMFCLNFGNICSSLPLGILVQQVSHLHKSEKDISHHK